MGLSMGNLDTKQSDWKVICFLMLLVLRLTGFHKEGSPNLILTYSHVSSYASLEVEKTDAETDRHTQTF